MCIRHNYNFILEWKSQLTITTTSTNTSTPCATSSSIPGVDKSFFLDTLLTCWRQMSVMVMVVWFGIFRSDRYKIVISSRWRAFQIVDRWVKNLLKIMQWYINRIGTYEVLLDEFHDDFIFFYSHQLSETRNLCFFLISVFFTYITEYNHRQLCKNYALPKYVKIEFDYMKKGVTHWKEGITTKKDLSA